MDSLISNFLSKEDLLDIKTAIIEAEAKTSGEIRVKVTNESGSDVVSDTRRYAIQEFYREGLYRTREGTGVLILVLLTARKFEIVADKGINSKISEETWQELSSIILNCFGAGNVRAGIVLAIREIGRLLAEHFPRGRDDINELPDKVLVEE